MKKKLIVFLTIFLFPLLLISGFSSWIIIGGGSATVGKTSSTKKVCYIGDTYYTSIEGALRNSVSGDVVHVILSKDTMINYDCTIPSGVILNIPYEEGVLVEDGTTTIGGTSSSLKKVANNTTHVLNVVTINSGVTLTIEKGGQLIIGGALSGSAGNGAYAGQTYSSHAQLILKDNAIIDSYGTIKCRGYIKEESDNGSKVINRSGSEQYLPFVLRDYRGGTSMSAIWTVKDDKACSPFNQFELLNVTCKNIIHQGASLYGWGNLYANKTVNSTDVNFIGTSSEFFIQLDTLNSYLEIDYYSEIMHLDFYGGAIFNALNMDAAGVSIETSAVYFPLTWRLNITLKKLPNQEIAVYNAESQMLKFMPGFSMIVEKEVELKSNNIIVYSCFYDKTNANLSGNVGGTAYANKAPANFEVYGKFTLMDGATFAGTIIKGTDAEFSSNIVNDKTLTSYEALIQEEGFISATITVWNVIKEKAFIINESDLVDNTIVTVGVTKWDVSYITPSFQIPEFQSTDILENTTKLLPIGTVLNPTLKTNIRTANYNLSYYQKSSTETISGKICYFTVVPPNEEMGSVDTDRVEIVDPIEKLTVGKSSTLKAVCYNADGKVSYTSQFTWSTSSKTTATVGSSSGKVTGKAKGTVTITAKSKESVGSKSATATIEILSTEEINTASISIEEGSQSYEGGQTVKLKLTVDPTSAVQSTEWTTTSESTAQHTTELVDDYNFNVTITDDGNKDTDKYVYVEVKITPILGDPVVKTITLTEQKDSSSSGGCFAKGTNVMLSNGNYEKIENLKVGDMIKTFNHESGQLEDQFITFIPYQSYNLFEILELEFENSIRIKVLFAHGFMNYDTKLYEEISKENVNEKIGNNYLFFDENEKIISSKLLSYSIYQEYTECYSLASAYNLNHIIDGALCISDDIQGLYNYFSLDESFKYDEELMKKDIEDYGLLLFEDVDDFMSYDIYEWFNVKYLSVSIGKGMITMDIMREYIRKYA